MSLNNYTIETDEIEISYDLLNVSFDHEFGTYISSLPEIRYIRVYVPALSDWMDVTHLEQFCLLADKIIEIKLAEAA